jgi:hypothetical protein
MGILGKRDFLVVSKVLISSMERASKRKRQMKSKASVMD